MIVEFDRSFSKSLLNLTDQSLLRKVEKAILQMEEAQSIADLPHTKKLGGFKNYYRLRIGDYRLGFERIDRRTVRCIIFAHRGDIYKYFP